MRRLAPDRLQRSYMYRAIALMMLTAPYCASTDTGVLASV